MKKRGRRTHREQLYCYKGKVVMSGTSGGIRPSIPVEFVGCDCIIVILPKGEEDD